MKRVVASASARVSLFGEYSKLIGESLTISLDQLQTKTLISLNSREKHSVFSREFNERVNFKIPKFVNKWSDYVAASLNILKKNHYQIPYLDFDISSDIPPNAGLASSSALTVAIINGISTLLSLNLSQDKIAKLSYLVETSELNIPCSYMDFYSCTIGGVQYIKYNPTSISHIKNYRLPKKAKIIIIETGMGKNTQEIITRIFKAHREGDEKITNHINLERRLIREALILLNNDFPDLEQLGELMQQAHLSYQINLQSSSSLHDQVCKTAMKAGCYGAKISGGGFGGACFALVSEKQEEQVKNALAKISKSVIISSVSYSGSQVNKPT